MLVIEMNFAKLFVFWLTISFILYTSLGEVTEMTPVETENPMGGYGKTVAHVIIGLKTAKGMKSKMLGQIVAKRFMALWWLMGAVVVDGALVVNGAVVVDGTVVVDGAAAILGFSMMFT